jgi:hypothetical protein
MSDAAAARPTFQYRLQREETEVLPLLVRWEHMHKQLQTWAND